MVVSYQASIVDIGQKRESDLIEVNPLTAGTAYIRVFIFY